MDEESVCIRRARLRAEASRPRIDIRAVFAFVIFCALSGSCVSVNDVLDREQDRRHPLKARRPIASGALTASAALTAAAVIAGAGLVGAWLLGGPFFATAAIYLLLLSAYSAFLKHIVILDVLTLAAGFVLRAVAGAVASSMCRSATGCCC